MEMDAGQSEPQPALQCQLRIRGKGYPRLSFIFPSLPLLPCIVSACTSWRAGNREPAHLLQGWFKNTQQRFSHCLVGTLSHSDTTEDLKELRLCG